jgi:hypothetical protein
MRLGSPAQKIWDIENQGIPVFAHHFMHV